MLVAARSSELVASRTRVHLDTIRAILGSDRAIAAVLDVSPSQVSRWRRGQLPDLENADRLGGFALVAEMLGRWLHPDAIGGWLRGANHHLDGATPAYMIRHARVADVVGAIESERAGVFG